MPWDSSFEGSSTLWHGGTPGRKPSRSPARPPRGNSPLRSSSASCRRLGAFPSSSFCFSSLVLGRSSCSRLLRRARLRRAKLRGARLRPLSLRLRPLCVGSRGRRHDERSWHACLLQALVPAGFVVRPCPKHHGTVARAAAGEAFAGFVLHHPCEAQAALAHAVSRHILERTLGLHALSKETAAAMLLRA